jgi:hypothetical protein
MRQQRIVEARAHLRGYVDEVRRALASAGFLVHRAEAMGGDDLDALVEVTIDASPVVELAWAEDIGWSVSHHLIGHTPTPWRYLHRELVPAPNAVVDFLHGVLGSNDDLGMIYPAQFRYRSQPIQSVIDALARYSGQGQRNPDEQRVHP